MHFSNLHLPGHLPPQPLLTWSSFPRRKHFPISIPKTSTRPQSAFPFACHGTKPKCRRFEIRNSVFADPKNGKDIEKVPESWVGLVWSVFPGGSWWNLRENDNVEITAAKPITVFLALRRMWELIAEDRWVVFVAVGSLVVAALSEISIPSVLAASIFSAQSGETMLFSRNSQFLVILCFTSGICSGLRSGCFGVANMILVKRLRETFYSAILFQDISFFDREAVGDLTSRLGADCQQLSWVIGNDVHLILRNAVQGTGALINLLNLSWPLALSTLLICSVLLTIFLFYGQYQKRAAKLTQEFTADANEVAQETLSLVRSVRAYGTERKEIGRYKQWLDKLVFINFRESVAYGLWNMSFSTLYRSTQVIALLLGGMSIMSGDVSAEQLTKYILYCEWLIYATWRFTDSLASLLQSVGASEKVFQLMDLLPSDQFLSKGVKLQRVMGNIRFVNVSFHYPSRLMVPILEDINISVQASEVVAIVGLSGSGKSTIVNLLLRLYEPINGQIYIDGLPLRELDIRWLRQKVGFVGQEPHLFHMDIKSNIRYGCSRHVEQEDIERAAKQAYAHEFISSLPAGYDTLVDDNLLSGGQKQRIAIARAILRDPAILILDEATSALDSENEHYVKGVLHSFRNDIKANRTVIVIAHRLSTIKAADRIIVMDSGRVIETGDHTELLLKDGLYARLFKAQRAPAHFSPKPIIRRLAHKEKLRRSHFNGPKTTITLFFATNHTARMA
ncbi:ABC transporter B family member 26, chloroplastic-like isoform X1 [Juglans microcarpa x Juglans regia]|uniref:ABC transporter B family member 26, chloroplastic-like isoform X1 n=1 Tax=Juglans microcarpa x Juglans regia TaxID=2249226 RepID=UPI001B7E4291|nr:ABC transporter B family member 26, chloroplastic-like isoform X1 [Juglans microcarpa x Juglans regia]